MIKLKQLLLEYRQGSSAITEYQFIKLFKLNCKNIKSLENVLYRGISNPAPNIMLFNSKNTDIARLPKGEKYEGFVN